MHGKGRNIVYTINLTQDEVAYVELLLSLDAMRIDSLDETIQLDHYKIRHELREKLFNVEVNNETNRI